MAIVNKARLEAVRTSQAHCHENGFFTTPSRQAGGLRGFRTLRQALQKHAPSVTEGGASCAPTTWLHHQERVLHLADPTRNTAASAPSATVVARQRGLYDICYGDLTP